MTKTTNPTNKLSNVKDQATKLYRIALCFASDAVMAAFAIIGIMSLIHTEARIQTGLAIFFVLLLLAVKFNNKK